MSDYNLAGLSSRSFEQLIQSLATAFIAPGTIIFGAGPDGGREATFEGKMQYPSATDPWNGYLVVQAKFLQRPLGTSRDGDWALTELERELKKFVRKRRRRRPDYYLFCTNAVLSAVEGTGHKDRAASIASRYRKRVPLKDFAIWDFDKLCTLLDNAPEIRKAYAAWITPGDVLSAMMSWLAGMQPDFAQVISRFLQADLLDDRYARLDQAGHTGKDLTPLARVFVDLSVTAQPETDPTTEDEATLDTGFVHELLLSGGQRLDSESLSHSRMADRRAPRVGRVVLIGGPGQGKTTISQYVCQLYRVSLLKHREGLLAEVADVIKLVETQCEIARVELPTARRFPVRVVLNGFARYLSANPEASLASFIIKLINDRTDTELEIRDLETWLSAYPWLLVLDGLDEVPASANRDAVLGAITKFLVLAHECRADILVLATTRPQGFGGQEFAVEYYAHRYLAPLSKARALFYGRRLANVMHGEASTLAKEIIGHLEAAIENEATARLMRSPLQVTIMAALSRKGPPPQERWLLFNKYYEVIYERETAKKTGATEILVRHKKDIDAIHHRVGLSLQIESERTGQTNARMSREEFCGIVEGRLREEGSPTSELARLGQQIIDAAEHRLVFLVGVQAGQIGFEIRSLQEYMAAEALMQGDDASVIERMRAIAPLWHWRNVFLFAAGKCFNHKAHLRETIVGICSTMNESEEAAELSRYSLVGSQLAVDILQDGLARGHWMYEKALASVACRVVERPPSELHVRLATCYNEHFGDAFRATTIPLNTISCWAVLLPLADRAVNWAAEFAIKHWPPDSESRLAILRFALRSSHSKWLQGRLSQSIPTISPAQLRSLPLGEDSDYPDWLQGAADVFLRPRGRRPFSPVGVSLPGGLSASLISLASSEQSPLARLAIMPGAVGPWQAIVAAGAFCVRPHPDTLSSALLRVAEFWEPRTAADLIRSAPWPLAAALSNCESGEDAQKLGQAAAAGNLGNSQSWAAAESRWLSGPVGWEDIVEYDRQGGVPGPALASAGFPLCSSGFAASPPDWEKTVDALVSLHVQLHSAQLRRVVASLAMWLGTMAKRVGRSLPSPQMLADAVDLNAFVYLGWMRFLAPSQLFSATWLDALEYAAIRTRFGGLYRELGPEFFGAIVLAYKQEPHRVGLVPILAHAVANDVDINVPAGSRDWEELENSNTRRASIILRLASPDLDTREVESLGRAVASFSDSESALASTCVSTARKFQSSGGYRRFLSALYKYSPDACWSLRSAAIAGIDDVMRTRRSTFDDPKTVRGLKLPVGPGS